MTYTRKKGGAKGKVVRATAKVLTASKGSTLLKKHYMKTGSRQLSSFVLPTSSASPALHTSMSHIPQMERTNLPSKQERQEQKVYNYLKHNNVPLNTPTNPFNKVQPPLNKPNLLNITKKVPTAANYFKNKVNVNKLPNLSPQIKAEVEKEIETIVLQNKESVLGMDTASKNLKNITLVGTSVSDLPIFAEDNFDKLIQLLNITSQNQKYLKNIHGLTQGSVTKYEEFIEGPIDLLKEQLTIDDLSNLKIIFNKSRMLRFKAGMVSVFKSSPSEAHAIFELFLLTAVGNIPLEHVKSDIKTHIAFIDQFINVLNFPFDVKKSPLLKVSALFQEKYDKEVDVRLAREIELSRKDNTFKFRLLYRFIIGGAGIIAIFLAAYYNVTSVEKLAVIIEEEKKKKEETQEDAEITIEEEKRRQEVINFANKPNKTVSDYIVRYYSYWEQYFYNLFKTIILHVAGYNLNKRKNSEKMRQDMRELLTSAFKYVSAIYAAKVAQKYIQ